MKLTKEYLGGREGSVIEVERTEAELLVSQKKGQYLVEIPKASNKMISTKKSRRLRI